MLNPQIETSASVQAVFPARALAVGYRNGEGLRDRLFYPETPRYHRLNPRT